jgi:hypothetical protein
LVRRQHPLRLDTELNATSLPAPLLGFFRPTTSFVKTFSTKGEINKNFLKTFLEFESRETF